MTKHSPTTRSPTDMIHIPPDLADRWSHTQYPKRRHKTSCSQNIISSLWSYEKAIKTGPKLFKWSCSHYYYYYYYCCCYATTTSTTTTLPWLHYYYFQFLCYPATFVEITPGYSESIKQNIDCQTKYRLPTLMVARQEAHPAYINLSFILETVRNKPWLLWNV